MNRRTSGKSGKRRPTAFDDGGDGRARLGLRRAIRGGASVERPDEPHDHAADASRAIGIHVARIHLVEIVPPRPITGCVLQGALTLPIIEPEQVLDDGTTGGRCQRERQAADDEKPTCHIDIVGNKGAGNSQKTTQWSRQAFS
jgi:hypothetical protein